MLAAIDAAQQSVALSTYIFDNDRAGALFADALERAVKRGVEVRVIIDAVGARYTFPSIVSRLQHAGVPVARFLPTLLPGRFAYSNLRSHRKILVVDGRIGFTGGLNIREGHDARFHPKHPIRGSSLPHRRPGRGTTAGSICRRLVLLRRGSAEQRDLVSAARSRAAMRWLAGSQPAPTTIWTSCD